MADRITLAFIGNNGLGTVQIPAFTPGQFGAQLLIVQRIIENVSTAPAPVLGGGAIATDSFGPDVTSTGQIQQTASNDWSDDLFMALIELG